MSSRIDVNYSVYSSVSVSYVTTYCIPQIQSCTSNRVCIVFNVINSCKRHFYKFCSVLIICKCMYINTRKQALVGVGKSQLTRRRRGEGKPERSQSGKVNV